MAWETGWIRIAVGERVFDQKLEYDGPSCYQLGIGTWPFIRVVYVGETDNERRRMLQYARGRSHLEDEIAYHLRRGEVLYYRGTERRSKRAAKAMQDRLLLEREYDWNLQGNR